MDQESSGIEVGRIYQLPGGVIRKILAVSEQGVTFVENKGTVLPGWDAGPLRTISLERFLAELGPAAPKDQ